MARNAPPHGLPRGAGTKIHAGLWEERKFPTGISDGLQSKWPSHPYRRSDERNYLTKLAQAWAERDGTARPGEFATNTIAHQQIDPYRHELLSGPAAWWLWRVRNGPTSRSANIQAIVRPPIRNILRFDTKIPNTLLLASGWQEWQMPVCQVRTLQTWARSTEATEEPGSPCCWAQRTNTSGFPTPAKTTI